MLVAALAGVFIASACSLFPGDGPLKGEPTQILVVSVGPMRVECSGPFPRMCLVVDGEYFYDEIDGFTHEPGYQYRLRIERYDAWPGQEEPPQDASRYGYRLLEVLEKAPAGG